MLHVSGYVFHYLLVQFFLTSWKAKVRIATFPVEFEPGGALLSLYKVLERNTTLCLEKYYGSSLRIYIHVRMYFMIRQCSRISKYSCEFL